METLFFILGIASVVVIATAIVAVVSIVKVTKLQASTKDNYDGVHYAIDDVHRLIDRVGEELSKKESDIHQVIAEENRQAHSRVDEIERYFTSQLDSRLDKLSSKTDRSVEELHRIFNDYFETKKNNK